MDIRGYPEHPYLSELVLGDFIICSECFRDVVKNFYDSYELMVIRDEVIEEEDSLRPSEPLKYKKKTIPESLRWKIWKRDNFTCQHCKTQAKLSTDHIYPESAGGEMTEENLQTLCKRCNSKKGKTIQSGA